MGRKHTYSQLQYVFKRIRLCTGRLHRVAHGLQYFSWNGQWATWYRECPSLTQIEMIHGQLSLRKLLIHLVCASQSLPSSTGNSSSLLYLLDKHGNICRQKDRNTPNTETQTSKIPGERNGLSIIHPDQTACFACSMRSLTVASPSTVLQTPGEWRLLLYLLFWGLSQCLLEKMKFPSAPGSSYNQRAKSHRI